MGHVCQQVVICSMAQHFKCAEDQKKTYDTLFFNQETMLTKLARLEESVRARKEEKEFIGDWKTCPNSIPRSAEGNERWQNGDQQGMM